MSTYISTNLSKDRNYVYVWERDNTNGRKRVTYTAPYYFYVEDEEGEYKSIFNQQLKKLEFDNSYSFFENRNTAKSNGIKLYESDFTPELKILSSKYYSKPVEDDLHVTFFDIEVDYDPKKGFSSPKNAYAPINSVAIYHKFSNKSIVFAVPPKKGKWKNCKLSDIENSLTSKEVEIVLLNNEKELLLAFLDEIEDSDVISGWNSSMFDVPYIYFRIVQALGKKYTKKLNFEDADDFPKVVEKEHFNNFEYTIKLQGRVSIDYLEMFRKFDPNERPSYALEAVAEEELNIPKLDFGKSLHALYNENFDEFINYNIRDTEILKELENEFKYMNLAIELSHMVGNHLTCVLGTVGIADTAILNHCNNNLNKIVPDAPEQDYDGKKFMGAFVLESQIGLHEWISSLDIKSLYPSAIRALNISPDTIRGQFLNNDKAFESLKNKENVDLTLLYENGFDETLSVNKWLQMFKEKNWTVSAHGTVFDQTFEGFLPEILTSWFQHRIELQNKKTEFKDKLKNVDEKSSEYTKLKQKKDYYDNMQYLRKILLNSMYGVLGNRFFRFFDVRLAESTTKTGRDVLIHMASKIAEILDGDYQYPSQSILAGDTDSCYFKTGAENKKDAVEIGDLINKIVNKSMPKYMANTFYCDYVRKTYIISERETVADRGIFVARKHYMLHLVDKDGYNVDEMKVMGLQIKKTTIPKPIRKRLVEFFEKFLKGEEWKKIKKEVVEFKKQLKEGNVLDLGVPTGINNVEKYTQEYNNDDTIRVPGHVKAAMLYNKCLNVYNDKESMEIRSGFKIKKFYFNKTFNGFNSIALPGDLDIIPEWFKNFEKYIDKDRQLLTLVDKPIKNILVAIGEVVPTAKNVMADELIEFGD